jgi:hypothetical protein
MALRSTVWDTDPKATGQSLLIRSSGAVSIFYATFIFFKIPITLLVKPLGPSKLSASSFTVTWRGSG